METKKIINIAEILANKPRGLKLWSPTFGQCTFDGIENEKENRVIVIKTTDADYWYLSLDGKYYKNGECTLFPSKSMRDWQKMKWKKGDVLVNQERNCYCIFDGWYKEDFTQVRAKHWMNFRNENNTEYLGENQPLTQLMGLATDKDADSYVCTLEERFEGKINPETLEIEKPQKPKCDLVPFQQVLVRDNDREIWNIEFFGWYEQGVNYPYHCRGGETYSQCIAYGGNEKLLGTNLPRYNTTNF